MVSKLRKKSVSIFIASLRAEGSRANYLSVLNLYFEHIYPELKEHPEKLDELSLQYVEDPYARDYEQDILNFRDNVIADHAPSTQKYKFRVIFRFLKVNDLEFDEQWKKNIVGKGRSVAKEVIPSPDEIRRIIYHMPPQGKSFTYCLIGGGMRINEALNINLKDLEFDFKAKYIKDDKAVSIPIPKVQIRVAKGEKPRFTFLTIEAKIEIEEWLNQGRDTYIEKLRNDPTYKRYKKLVDEDKVFPFGADTFRSIWETALKKAGLYEVDDNVLRPRITRRIHAIRKFFRTWGGWSNPDVPQCLMGHQEGMDALYSRPDQALQILVEEFLRAEPNLMLKKTVPGIREENKRIREIVENLTERLGSLEALKERIEELESYLSPDGPVVKGEVEALRKSAEELKQ